MKLAFDLNSKETMLLLKAVNFKIDNLESRLKTSYATNEERVADELQLAEFESLFQTIKKVTN